MQYEYKMEELLGKKENNRHNILHTSYLRLWIYFSMCPEEYGAVFFEKMFDLVSWMSY